MHDHTGETREASGAAGILSRRALIALLGGAALAGCSSGGYEPPPPPSLLPGPAAGLPPPTGDALGTGSVRVALLLPRTAQGNAAGLATAMRNAAELGLEEFRQNDLTVLVKDTMGTPEGAVQAANAALADQVELVIGPVFAAEVRAAGPVLRNAGVPVLSFSSDPTVAAPGVYVMGFLVDDQVNRILAESARAGRTAMAALVPESPYGTLAEAALRQGAARYGVRLVQVERYGAGAAPERARAIAANGAQIDSVFIPEGPGVAPAAAAALASGGLDRARVKLLGSGQWNDPAVFSDPALAGGWFPAPDIQSFDTFAGRYRARYGSPPQLTATLAYDAVVLAAGLVRAAGAQRFQPQVLANPEGFLSSVNGLFRFNADGTNDRGLAVYEVTGGAPRLVSAGARSFSGA